VQEVRSNSQDNAVETKKEDKLALQSTSGTESCSDAEQLTNVVMATSSGNAYNENETLPSSQAKNTSAEYRDDHISVDVVVYEDEEELRDNPDTLDHALSKSNSQTAEGSVTDADESTAFFDDGESTMMTFQDTFSVSLVLDSHLAIFRSNEEMQREAEPDEEEAATTNYSVVTADSGVSDLAPLERFFKIFRCSEDDSFDKCNDDAKSVRNENEVSEETTTATKSPAPQRFFMLGDETVRSEQEASTSERSGGKDSTSGNIQEEISSAFSSPSRRTYRSFMVSSNSSDQEVDQMIEIAASDSHIVDNQKKEDSRDDVDDFWQPQISVSNDHDTNEEAPNVVLESVHSENPSKVTLPIKSLAHLSGRTSPVILRDQQTMLPDNLSPMARLRYCSHIGGRYSLLVTKERCYV
jgi:hypothetical protein